MMLRLSASIGNRSLVGNRVALAAAWNIDNRLHLHGDIWVVNRRLVDPVDWYVGVGGKVLLLSEDVKAGVRVPVGIQWFALQQLELFAEIVPGLQIIDKTAFGLDAGIGVRYHFR